MLDDDVWSSNRRSGHVTCDRVIEGSQDKKIVEIKATVMTVKVFGGSTRRLFSGEV